MYLCILVHCKECQHTEKSRSIQVVLMVPSPQEYPGDLEGHEAQRSQKDPGSLFSTRLVALQKGREKVSEASLKRESLEFPTETHWHNP